MSWEKWALILNLFCFSILIIFEVHFNLKLSVRLKGKNENTCVRTHECVWVCECKQACEMYECNNVCMSVRACDCGFACVWKWACECEYECVSACVWMWVCECVWIYECLVNVFEYESVNVCVSACVWMCECLHVCLYESMRVCECVCVCDGCFGEDGSVGLLPRTIWSRSQGTDLVLEAVFQSCGGQWRVCKTESEETAQPSGCDCWSLSQYPLHLTPSSSSSVIWLLQGEMLFSPGLLWHCGP